MKQAFIGVDVGTSSARAGVFDEKGTLLATARHPIATWHEAGGVVEQSSSDIWAACVAAVRAAMAEADLTPSAVKGLGFDATCSLVVLDAQANPLTVSPSGDHRRNVIVWMDHRAIAAPGTPLGTGLSPSAARDFGLEEGTPVGASLIDAHAGGVGTIGGREKSGRPVDVCRRLAYIMGTSACIMATTSEARFVPGVWGPYYSGMVPGFWLNEGGQSAAGAAIDHLIKSHPAYNPTLAARHSARIEILEFLELRIVSRVKSPGEAAVFARDIHVMPEFLGHRSPFADPGSRAPIPGLDLCADIG